MKNTVSTCINLLTILSIIILAGWQLHPAWFQHRYPNYFGCNPVAAISFLLLTWGFRMIGADRPVRSVLLPSGLLVMVALLKLADLLLIDPLNLDEYLFRSVLTGTRLTYPAAFCFLLFSLLLVIHALSQKRAHRYLLLLLVPVFLMCLLSWFGFVLNDHLILDALPFAPMSLFTTGLFSLCLLISVRLFPDRWIVQTVASPRLGGLIARQLLPWLGIIPLLIFLGRQYWESKHLFAKDFAVSVELTILFAVLCLVVIRLTRTINQIDERERANLLLLQHQSEALRIANEALQTSYDEMEQFTFAASHDLQEPLRKIITFSDLLQQPAGMRPVSTDYQQKITDTAQRMAKLLKALLQYSKLKQDYDAESVDLASVVADVQQDLELQIGQLGADIQVGLLPSVYAVPHQMHQLFLNLIANALKFAQPDRVPIIQVAATATVLNEVHLSVRDNGIGFDPGRADQLFTVFKRLHSTQKYPGTGLGLSICQKIVSKHHGRIWAVNNPDGGATFHMVLPAAL